MIRLSHIVTAVIVLLMILPGMVLGFDDEWSRETLRGIKGVRVVVGPIRPEIEKTGLTRSQIQTNVELKLRMAGVSVWSPKYPVKRHEQYEWGQLYVFADILRIWSGAYVYVLQLEVTQFTHLARNKKIAMAATWSKGTYGIDEDLDKVRSTAKDLVDSFINAWLSVNPKKSEGSDDN